MDNERLNQMFRQVASAQAQLNELNREVMAEEGILNSFIRDINPTAGMASIPWGLPETEGSRQR